jgi:hypothetical protein
MTGEAKIRLLWPEESLVAAAVWQAARLVVLIEHVSGAA